MSEALEKIDPRYRIGLVGSYHKGVYYCPGCGLGNHMGDLNLFDNIKGFASSPIGLVSIVECPECFTKWYYHCDIFSTCNTYEYFLEAVEDGCNIHYNKE